jgi:hypothetical protein
MEDERMRFEDYLEQYQHIKAFIKGPTGIGKTYFAASISQACKTLYVDVEGGLLSAVGVVKGPNVTVRLIKEIDHRAFFNRLSDIMAEAMSGQYQAVVIDSIGEIAGRMEDEYASKDEKGTVDIKSWFILTERVKRFSRLLRDLPCHTIVTCLTKPTGKDDGKTIFEPILPGQTAAVVPSFFDIVGLLRKGAGKTGNEYYLVTNGISLFQVRDRTHTLDPEERVTQDKPHLVWDKVLTGMAKLTQKEEKANV